MTNVDIRIRRRDRKTRKKRVFYKTHIIIMS